MRTTQEVVQAAMKTAIDDEVRSFLADCAALEERGRLSPRQAAIRVVASLEARAGAKGFEAAPAGGLADRAVELRVRGVPCCVVRAAHGAVYVDPPGGVPLLGERVALVFDDILGRLVADDVAAWPDPVDLVEACVARTVRERAATRHAS